MNRSPQPAPIMDEGLRCSVCDYNLTGLTGDRCPECGTTIDWAAVRELRDEADRYSGTWWDRARWYWKPASFFVTASQAAFAPWLLARQLKDRPRLSGPLSFLAICMLLGAGMVGIVESSPDTAGPWMTGVTCQVALQTLLFGSVLSLPRVRFPMRFWLAVSAYFSYPLLVEWWSGLPMIGPNSTVWPFPVGQLEHQIGPTILFYWWWIGLATFVFVRIPSRHRWRAVAAVLAIPLLACASTIVGCELGGRFFSR